MEELNYHHGNRAQNFAFDILGVGPKGKTRREKTAGNEDYYAFGRKILAPGDGQVTDVIDGIRDNMPGSPNPLMALGNAIFIQHREHEISVLAHLKKGSIKVKVGDEVKRGQVIGLCGNSGNSSEPHLHYHVQNTPVMQDASGIKVRFKSLGVKKGKTPYHKKQYSPIKGDILSHFFAK